MKKAVMMRCLVAFDIRHFDDDDDEDAKARPEDVEVEQGVAPSTPSIQKVAVRVEPGWWRESEHKAGACTVVLLGQRRTAFGWFSSSITTCSGTEGGGSILCYEIDLMEGVREEGVFLFSKER